ncbi:sensor histidine kinase [Streptomyces sp. ME19-01-6]|uniref:sensor histidine kinase n=1 Tax=Streptomyces sp. ME19-01-6 TaxID=3028686 RepID=UPI0029BB16B0|nr:histidine kinase [Streptomyces sp. ME19-01-6]MDX3224749.1 histidine kinase [Streptomyces sp. ME19-01-6]
MGTRGTARSWLRRGLRLAGGLLIGTGTALVELVCVAAAGLALLCVRTWPGRWPTAQRCVLRTVTAGARRLTEIERRRLARFLGHDIAADYDDPGARQYLAGRWSLGLLGGLVLLSVGVGAAYGSLLLWGWFIISDGEWLPVAASAIGGLFLLFLALQGIVGVATLEGQLARHHLGPSHQEALRRRIDELSTSRAGVVDAVHDERRRIERDLHDGVQQRLVALGMLLGRARRSQDPDKARALLVQAHEESRAALTDLREVAWRVYPTALDEAGLRAALEAVAERSPIPVRLEYGLAAEPEEAVRTVAYFVVAEAVTNAIKHSDAGRLTVALTRREAQADVEGETAVGGLLVRVTDDGKGGADPAGGGLLGLARRVAALDGRLWVVSPPGGPTTVSAELPCA